MSQAPAMPTPTPSRAPLGRPRSVALRRVREGAVMGVLILCGVFSVGITLLILAILIRECWQFFAHANVNDQNEMIRVTLWDFFGTSTWEPTANKFGVWPLILGTFKIVVIAMAFALPTGLAVAIWLSEYADRRVRAVVKPVLEVLAGVPTVVFGFFALMALTPALRAIGGKVGVDFDIYNALSAGLAVGIMCLPIVTSLAEDALRAVPNALREGAYGMGSSRFEASIKVILPAALSGIVAAFLLAIARAVGETMIVALAAGSKPEAIVDPLDGTLQYGNIVAINEPTQTMTGYMVQVFGGDAAHETVGYYSSYAVAMTLFVITLGITMLGGLIRKRFRQAYQ